MDIIFNWMQSCRSIEEQETHFNQTEDASQPEDPHHPEQSGRDGEFVEDILHDQADDGSRHEDQIEEVPRQREVVVT